MHKKATKPPSALGLPRPSTEWLLILPPDLSSNASDALRAARADDRLYDLLCLNRLERVINTHGDILVSNASKEICFISSPGNGLFLTASPRTTPNAGQWHETKANTGWDGGKKATKPPLKATVAQLRVEMEVRLVPLEEREEESSDDRVYSQVKAQIERPGILG